MKSQMASPGFTDVFAALVAVVNTKFPEVGDLLLRRIVLQLKRAYKRNDKVWCVACFLGSILCIKFDFIFVLFLVVFFICLSSFIASITSSCY